MSDWLKIKKIAQIKFCGVVELSHSVEIKFRGRFQNLRNSQNLGLRKKK